MASLSRDYNEGVISEAEGDCVVVVQTANVNLHDSHSSYDHHNGNDHNNTINNKGSSSSCCPLNGSCNGLVLCKGVQAPWEPSELHHAIAASSLMR